MTEVITAGGGPGEPPSRARRRAPADLPFDFASDAFLGDLLRQREEPGWLEADRRAGLAAFAALPVETNPLYTTYVDFRSADLFAARPVVVAPDGVARPAPVAEEAAAVAELDEEEVVTFALGPDAAAGGLVLETLGAALRRDPDGLRHGLADGGLLPRDDKLAQLVRAGWAQGIHLVVPPGLRLERPVVLRWRVGRPHRALLTRTIITVGEGASLSVVEELVGRRGGGGTAEEVGGGQTLFSGTLEVRLGRGATLALASLQEFPTSVVAFQHRAAVLDEGAELRWALAQLGGRLVRSRVDNRLLGNHATAEQVEIVFGADDQHFDLTSYTRHVGRETTGNLLAKSVLLDRARAWMKGLITIEKSAVGTDSFLGEFGMNLSKQARAVAIPSLEIDQPDCRRAAHSSSVGPIDETQVFYLESRGIPELEARKFIVLGFLEPVVARVPLAAAQERLRHLLEAKWSAAAAPAAA
jgi:Fe-S cluster assembly scaffold protein SufB